MVTHLADFSCESLIEMEMEILLVTSAQQENNNASLIFVGFIINIIKINN